jgi:uncharacterized protein (TIGR00369 family)
MSEARPRLKLADQQQGFSSLIGPFYEIELEQSFRRALPLDARHLNPEGFVHGGVLSAFADYVLYRAIGDVLGHEQAIATVSLHVQFLAAARAHQWLYGEGLVVKRTRTLVFATGELFTEDQQIVQATGVWKLIGA